MISLSLLIQVVSGCEGGVVSVWDVDSGCQVLRMAECHERNEITAMCLDVTGRRLATGSRAGDIKVGKQTSKQKSNNNNNTMMMTTSLKAVQHVQEQIHIFLSERELR